MGCWYNASIAPRSNRKTPTSKFCLPFTTAFSGLFPRCICELKPKDLCNITSGFLGSGLWVVRQLVDLDFFPCSVCVWDNMCKVGICKLGLNNKQQPLAVIISRLDQHNHSKLFTPCHMHPVGWQERLRTAVYSGRCSGFGGLTCLIIFFFFFFKCEQNISVHFDAHDCAQQSHFQTKKTKRRGMK